MGSKIVFSSVLVGAGAALAAGGPMVFVILAALAWRYLHVLLFVLAGALVLVAVVPRRALAVPATLALLGLGVMLVRDHGVGPVARFGGGVSLAVLGIMVAMRPTREVSLHRRRWAVLFRRCMEPKQAPARIRLVAVGGGRLTVDLAKAANQSDQIQLFLSTWYGRIKLEFPPSWVVVAGRVAATRDVAFEGSLDWNRGFADPDAEREKLERLRARIAASTGGRDCVAVVHVLGVGGRVTVDRGKS
jgi:hypothetical protein